MPKEYEFDLVLDQYPGVVTYWAQFAIQEYRREVVLKKLRESSTSDSDWKVRETGGFFYIEAPVKYTGTYTLPQLERELGVHLPIDEVDPDSNLIYWGLLDENIWKKRIHHEDLPEDRS